MTAAGCGALEWASTANLLLNLLLEAVSAGSSCHCLCVLRLSVHEARREPRPQCQFEGAGGNGSGDQRTLLTH